MANNSPVIFPLAGKRVWVAGSRGMIGSALLRRLAKEPCEVLTDKGVLDLRDAPSVKSWLAANKPDVIFVAAGKVGGILANVTHPADFLYDNLAIATNVTRCAVDAGVSKLLYLSAASAYPKLALQPISEDSLLEGPMEPASLWFGLAKVAGVKLCEAFRRQYGCDFISVTPASVYGPGDRFDSDNGNVIPALLRRAYEAKANYTKQLIVWGSGKVLREFIYVHDCVDALIFLIQTYSDSKTINIGTGQEVSITELAQKISAVVDFDGELVFDDTKPEGVPRKLLDSSRIFNMGWRPKVSLYDGLTQSYRWWIVERAGCRYEFSD